MNWSGLTLVCSATFFTVRVFNLCLDLSYMCHVSEHTLFDSYFVCTRHIFEIKAAGLLHVPLVCLEQNQPIVSRFLRTSSSIHEGLSLQYWVDQLTWCRKCSSVIIIMIDDHWSFIIHWCVIFYADLCWVFVPVLIVLREPFFAPAGGSIFR